MPEPVSHHNTILRQILAFFPRHEASALVPLKFYFNVYEASVAKNESSILDFSYLMLKS